MSCGRRWYSVGVLVYRFDDSFYHSLIITFNSLPSDCEVKNRLSLILDFVDFAKVAGIGRDDHLSEFDGVPLDSLYSCTSKGPIVFK